MTDIVDVSLGVTIQEEISEQEWAERLQFHIGVQIANPLILGDLINYGKLHFPDTWEDAFPDWLPERKKQTLRNWASIMRRVPHAVRQAGLGISHYDAVAALPEPDQKELLELAVVDGIMPRDELRRLAAERRGRELPCRVTGTGWLKITENPLRWEIEPLQIEGEIEEGEVYLSLRNVN